MDLYFGIGLMILLFLATPFFYEKKIDDLEQEVRRLKILCGLIHEPPSEEDDDEW